MVNQKKIFEIACKNTSEIGKLNLCWQEAQKELLERLINEIENNEDESIGVETLKAELRLITKDTNNTSKENK